MSVPTRTQLDRTGERIRDGAATAEDWTVLTEYRSSVRDAVAPLLHHVRTIARKSEFPFTARLKTNYSIEQKLHRTTIRLRQIDDIMGCRIIVPERKDQNFLTTSITELGQARVRDRREDSSHGYRAVHVILGRQPYLEVQIRTKFQDAWAELSERAADRHGIEIKYGGGSDDIRLMLEIASSYIDSVERDSELGSEDALPMEIVEGQINLILEMAHRALL